MKRCAASHVASHPRSAAAFGTRTQLSALSSLTRRGALLLPHPRRPRRGSSCCSHVFHMSPGAAPLHPCLLKGLLPHSFSEPHWRGSGCMTSPLVIPPCESLHSIRVTFSHVCDAVREGATTGARSRPRPQNARRGATKGQQAGNPCCISCVAAHGVVVSTLESGQAEAAIVGHTAGSQ